MTDPQPNKTHFDTTQPRLNKNSSQISTNHVRVHAAHDREHNYYNSFTLSRGCTCSPWVMIILGKLNTHCIDDHPYTLLRYVLRNHYKAIQSFHLACNVPTEVSPPVWASRTHPEAPSCAIWVPAIAAIPTPSHYLAIVASPNIPVVLPLQLHRTASSYAKTKLYHILCQAVPI
jgi:hypothetical protein